MSPRSDFIIKLGDGDAAGRPGRAPRFSFDDLAEIL